VYNILCDSLGITPLPNNGTLRLPLTPVGLHSDEDAPSVEAPVDPPASSPSGTSGTMSPIPSGTALKHPSPATESSAPPTQRPDSDDEAGPTWWGTLWDKFEGLKDWATDIFDTVKDNFATSS
jgi:hypothetical protein